MVVEVDATVFASVERITRVVAVVVVLDAIVVAMVLKG